MVVFLIFLLGVPMRWGVWLDVLQLSIKLLGPQEAESLSNNKLANNIEAAITHTRIKCLAVQEISFFSGQEIIQASSRLL